MNKEEFKEIFFECFTLEMSVEYKPSNWQSSDWALEVRIVDKDTSDIVTATDVNMGKFKD